MRHVGKANLAVLNRYRQRKRTWGTRDAARYLFDNYFIRGIPISAYTLDEVLFHIEQVADRDAFKLRESPELEKL